MAQAWQGAIARRCAAIVSLYRGEERVIQSDQKTIKTLPDSELSRTLKAAQASGEPVIVDTGEDVYTLLVVQAVPAPDVFAHYDPEAAIAGLRALDDALAGVDRDQLLRDLNEQRVQDSFGRPA
jgi:hypothetical protein